MRKILEKLNKHFFPLVVAFVLSFALFISIIPSVNAAALDKPLDYRSYDYTITENANSKTITVPVSPDFVSFAIINQTTGKKQFAQEGSYSIKRKLDANTKYTIQIYPASTYGVALADLPEGTQLVIGSYVSTSVTGTASVNPPDVYTREYFRYPSGSYTNPVLRKLTIDSFENFWAGQSWQFVFEIGEHPSSVTSYVPSLMYQNFQHYNSTATEFEFGFEYAYLKFEISNGYWEEWLSKQTGEQIQGAADQITGSIEDSADKISGAVGDAADSIITGTPEMDNAANESNQEMSAAVDKLDNLGDQLNSVDKPNANNMNVSADRLLGGMAATIMLTAPIREIWNSPVALSILTVVVTIVLLSWVFFGKK